MKQLLFFSLLCCSFIVFAEKTHKPTKKNTPVQKQVTKTDTTNVDYGFRVYDSRLGRYYHIDPQQQSPYDSLQRK